VTHVDVLPACLHVHICFSGCLCATQTSTERSMHMKTCRHTYLHKPHAGTRTYTNHTSFKPPLDTLKLTVLLKAALHWSVQSEGALQGCGNRKRPIEAIFPPLLAKYGQASCCILTGLRFLQQHRLDLDTAAGII
jgi:hypothetical protein